MITPFDKAIVALLVPVIVQWLISIGVPTTSDVATNIVTWLITGLLTALAVFLTKNKATA